MLDRRAHVIMPDEIGGKDWSDLAVLSGSGTRLGRAIRKAQLYFTDEELSSAIEGRSKTVLLTVVNDELAFLNAAMIADVMSDTGIQSVTETQ